MLIGWLLESLWCLSLGRLICGAFGYWSVHFWEGVVCFLQDISGLCMGLFVLAVGYLAYISLLQRYCLVVGCCVLY